MNTWIDMNGETDIQTIDVHTDRQIHGETDATWTDGQTDRHADTWMDGQTDTQQ